MNKKPLIAIMVFAYLLGIGASANFYLKTRPSEETLRLLKMDSAIRADLCARISQDIDNFRESPHTFKRSSLKALLSESTATSKALTINDNDSEPVKFRGLDGKSVVFSCEKEAQKWVKIPTAFPEYYESELALVNGETRLLNADLVPLPQNAVLNQKSKRLALVIGNASYENHPLKNPINDAKDISAALKNSNFRVIELYDADRGNMERSINYFSQELSRYDVGLIYYSGHGIEFSGRNYFIPINADIKSEEEIPRQGFDVTQIVEKMGRSNVKTAIFIIDACRNAPIFSKFKGADSGLAIMQGSAGTVLAYSAAPGHVALDGNGRNSPYTSALLKQLQIPNKKIEDVMKDTAKAVSDETAGRQIPWYNSSLIGDFYFLKK